MKKKLVVLVDPFTCQKNGVSFDDYVRRLSAGFEEYETKVMRDPATQSSDGDYSRAWAASKVSFEGTPDEENRIFETVRIIFGELKNAAH